MPPGSSEPSRVLGITRRRALTAAGATVGAGLATGGYVVTRPEEAQTPAAVPFHGPHQAGIATPQQRHLTLAALDLTAGSAADLQQLFRAWTVAAQRLTAGRPAAVAATTGGGRADPGEADGLGHASLTLTFGLGPTLFEREGEDRLGLLERKPRRLAQLAPLPGDELQVHRSHGDLCIQACADDPQVAFHAIHVLLLAAHGIAVPRWAQQGFLPARSASPHSPRNLMGFKDGTNNLATDHRDAMKRHVWTGADDQPWMRGGTYLVARRIRMLLDVWDGLTTDQQQSVIGRDKASGAPLGRSHENDKVDLEKRRAGNPVIPVDGHIRLAAASQNRGVQILRRSYSYSDGVDPATGQIDAGLVFICFQRDPQAQFAAIQTRLGTNDALAKHISHTSSAVFACLPGTRPGGYIGETLIA